MTNEPCQRCGGSGWITTPNALCTDNKTRIVRCKCPVCNHGNAERENDCARAVDEFIQSHHNPIVAGKNAEISAMAARIATLESQVKLLREECRAWRDPKHAVVCEWGHTCPDGRTAIPYGCSACESRDKLRAARAATDAAGALGEK